MFSSRTVRPWIAHTHPSGWNSSALKQGYLVVQGHHRQKDEHGDRAGSSPKVSFTIQGCVDAQGLGLNMGPFWCSRATLQLCPCRLQ